MRRRNSGLVLAAALWIGCASSPAPPESSPLAGASLAAEGPAPLRAGFARVARVREVGAYLEAHLETRGGPSGLLFVANEPCRAVLLEGTEVRIEPAQPFADLFGNGAGPCGATGISLLAGWRDRLPPRRSELLVPTESAELRLLLATESGELLAVGKLPLALELRWPTPLDVVALLPDTPACRAHLARGHTTLEFRARGEHPLVLRGRLEPCPVLGLAEPIYLL